MDRTATPGYYEGVRDVMARFAKKEVIYKQLHTSDTNTNESINDTSCPPVQYALLTPSSRLITSLIRDLGDARTIKSLDIICGRACAYRRADDDFKQAFFSQSSQTATVIRDSATGMPLEQKLRPATSGTAPATPSPTTAPFGSLTEQPSAPPVSDPVAKNLASNALGSPPTSPPPPPPLPALALDSPELPHQNTRAELEAGSPAQFLPRTPALLDVATDHLHGRSKHRHRSGDALNGTAQEGGFSNGGGRPRRAWNRGHQAQHPPAESSTSSDAWRMLQGHVEMLKVNISSLNISMLEPVEPSESAFAGLEETHRLVEMGQDSDDDGVNKNYSSVADDGEAAVAASSDSSQTLSNSDDEVFNSAVSVAIGGRSADRARHEDVEPAGDPSVLILHRQDLARAHTDDLQLAPHISHQPGTGTSKQLSPVPPDGGRRPRPHQRKPSPATGREREGDLKSTSQQQVGSSAKQATARPAAAHRSGPPSEEGGTHALSREAQALLKNVLAGAFNPSNDSHSGLHILFAEFSVNSSHVPDSYAQSMIHTGTRKRARGWANQVGNTTRQRGNDNMGMRTSAATALEARESVVEWKSHQMEKGNEYSVQLMKLLDEADGCEHGNAIQLNSTLCRLLQRASDEEAVSRDPSAEEKEAASNVLKPVADMIAKDNDVMQNLSVEFSKVLSVLKNTAQMIESEKKEHRARHEGPSHERSKKPTAVSRAQQFAAAAQDMFEQEINGEGEGNVETEQLGDKPDIQDIAFNEVLARKKERKKLKQAALTMEDNDI
ncbi:hypothetical protein CYMTET_42232 [Cymbomonas tetramitiformis]|uniref:Uncharacterized protein n=1 Tax=Cymbomonas tetramitiformis TaxID=36881 RepID=A0AAE0C4J7_9CHLO|nr:hypothetical protein CYMTET_42232 [Cymbomonas tetramitiformis]